MSLRSNTAEGRSRGPYYLIEQGTSVSGMRIMHDRGDTPSFSLDLGYFFLCQVTSESTQHRSVSDKLHYHSLWHGPHRPSETHLKSPVLTAATAKTLFTLIHSALFTKLRFHGYALLSGRRVTKENASVHLVSLVRAVNNIRTIFFLLCRGEIPF